VIKPILIICGEPNSIFSEIIVKSSKKYRSKNPIILIGSYKLISSQIKKLKLKNTLNKVNFEKEKFINIKNNKINIINVSYKFNKPFEKISAKSNNYIKKSFNKFFEISKLHNISGLINGPISKKYFLKNRYLGVTEYLTKKFKIKEDYSMLIYNKSLSVSPITTHLPLSRVSNHIKKNNIISKILIIDKFYKQKLSKNPKIAITGLNPHCENFFNLSEEKKIIEPAIKVLKKRKIKITGPFPADTIFLRQNMKKFDVIVGMYHDQVLTPVKTIYGFNAINITLGLPFIRVSPDHGPNFNMIGKNESDPRSLINAIKFLDNIK
jgi:4-hydroxythreonine-4-phosphate dehydrogenase